jgi:hypothetical protein
VSEKEFVTQIIIEPPRGFKTEEDAKSWADSLAEQLGHMCPKNTNVEVHVYGPPE